MITGYGHIATMEFQTEPTQYPDTALKQARRLRFYKRGYSGTVHTLCGSNKPVSGKVGDDDLFGPKGCSITIELFLENVYLSEFFAKDDRDVWVHLEGGPIDLLDPVPFVASVWATRFMGWVTPFDASEPYSKLAYVASLRAKCGLDSLKDFPFYSYPLSRQLSGPDRILDIIQNILFWTGPDRPLWVSMTTWNAADPAATLLGLQDTQESLTYSKIHLQNFKNKEGYRSCHDVLTEICTAFNARLLLDPELGVWKFLRVDEIPLTTGNRKWVIYDNAPDTTGTYFAENPRLTIGTDQRPIDAATLSIEPATPSQKVVFSYGDLYNILRNGDFSAGLSNWVVPDVTKWYPSFAFDQSPVNFPVAALGTGLEESPFALRITGTSLFSQNRYVTPTRWQVINVTRTSREDPRLVNFNLPGFDKSIVDPHLLTLSFEYLNRNTGGPKVRLWVLVTKRTGGLTSFSLSESGTWVQGNKEAVYFMPRNVYKDGAVERAKPTNGEQFEVTATEPVPGVGNYIIYLELYAGTEISGPVANQPVTIEYRNFKVTKDIITSVVLLKDQVTARTYDFDPARRPRKEETSLTVGSQQSTKGGSSIRMATVLNGDGETAANNWLVLLPGAVLVGGSIQELCALGRLRMTHSHARTFEGQLTRRCGPFGMLTFTELGYTGFVLTYEWEEKTAFSTVRTLEVLPLVTIPPTIKREYVTEDGSVIPMTGTGETPPAEIKNNKPTLSIPLISAIMGPARDGGGNGMSVVMRSNALDDQNLKIYNP